MSNISKSNLKKSNFTYIWRIENFSLCFLRKGKHLDSQSFVVKEIPETVWYLGLYPTGDGPNRCMSCFLCRHVNDNEPETIAINFTLSFLDSKGIALSRLEFIEQKFNKGDAFGFVPYKRRSEYFKDKKKLLHKDTLTVKCQIWKCDSEMKSSVLCSALTRIGADRTSFLWNIENFSTYEEKQKHSIAIPIQSNLPLSFNMIFFLNGGSTFGESVQIQIGKVGENPDRQMYAFCRISVLDIGGEVLVSGEDQHIFEFPEDSLWSFPPFVRRSDLIEKNKLCLPDDVLTLRCEFAISTGELFEDIESYFDSLVPNEMFEHSSKCGANRLRKDLLKLYVHNICCDTILRGSNGRILAHRTVLCAKSPVFCDIFQKKIKGKFNGIVDLPDLEVEVLSGMIMFMYTDCLFDLQWEKCLKFYKAADKYELKDMKEKCAEFLKSNLTIENVYSVLSLGETHQDNDLKSASEDFILGHASELVLSNDWKKFLKQTF